MPANVPNKCDSVDMLAALTPDCVITNTSNCSNTTFASIKQIIDMPNHLSLQAIAKAPSTIQLCKMSEKPT